jgi:hypothetical protein
MNLSMHVPRFRVNRESIRAVYRQVIAEELVCQTVTAPPGFDRLVSCRRLRCGFKGDRARWVNRRRRVVSITVPVPLHRELR